MDRRNFLKAVFAAPLLPRLLGESRSSGVEGGALYLISDSPEDVLPLLVNELERSAGRRGNRFALLNSHPASRALEGSLRRSGWSPSPQPSEADLSLSFRPLNLAAAPSFAWIKDGRVCDIRTDRLYRLWEEMNGSLATSSCLTIASFRRERIISPSGRNAVFYIDGAKAGAISLAKDQVKSIRTRNGPVVVAVENGAARILSSTCRHQICLASAPVCLAGERIVCAPNHFLLEIDGPSGVDTVTG